MCSLLFARAFDPIASTHPLLRYTPLHHCKTIHRYFLYYSFFSMSMNSFVDLAPDRALKVAYLMGALIGDQQCW